MIVHFTVVKVLYIPKFNVLHMAHSFAAGIVAEIILTSISYGDRSLKSGASDWFIWKVH